MATINWTIKKETFNPNKNYFEVENIKVSREESEIEIKNNKLSSLYDGLSTVILVLCSTVAAISGVIFLATVFNDPRYCLVFLVSFVISFLIAIFGCKLLSKTADRHQAIVYTYYEENDVWNTPLVKEIKAYNAEQELIAAEWRTKHPLEEKIRACIKDPKSSVEIADLARFYAKEYLLMEKNNETLD